MQRQEHQKLGAEFRISSKKHQFLKHQRRGWQQIPKIGKKSERDRNFNIASKTACRGFKSFCPCQVGEQKRCTSRKAPILGAFRGFRGRKTARFFRRCIWLILRLVRTRTPVASFLSLASPFFQENSILSQSSVRVENLCAFL